MSRKSTLDAAHNNPKGIRFADLCALVVAAGYVLRNTRGSHHVYRHATRPELPLIVLQSDKGKAKPYQVRQVVKVIEEHRLEVK